MSSYQKPTAMLAHMPWFIKRTIAHSADPVTLLNLRLCNQEFNHYAQSAPTDYHKVVIWIEEGIAYFDYAITDGLKTLWSNFSVDCSEAVEQFAELLKHKGSSIGELCLGVEDSRTIVDQLVEYLREREAPLCVKKIKLEVAESEPVPWIHRIVSQLKPGVLETIEFGQSDEVHPSDMEALGESEQWKKAKKVQMFALMELPYSKWSHLEFEHLFVEDLPVEAVKGIMERFCRDPNWKAMTITHNGKFDRGTATYFRQFGLRRESYPQMIRNPLNDTETINVQVGAKEISAHRNGIYKYC